MKATIDIPDELYREVKIKAASEGRTVREVVINALQTSLSSNWDGMPEIHTKNGFPVIRLGKGTIPALTNEQIAELLD
ncbi:MAG: hypothetical protein NW208_03750 [Bryobacter sp.]|nr:hypothetical protein [Bryobacter sp.]